MEIGVERGEQDAQPGRLGQREQVVPQLDHRRHDGPGRLLEEELARLRVFQHQPQHRDAVAPQPVQVVAHGGQVAPADQPAQLVPADGVVLADRVPVGATLLDEIGRARGHADPGHARGGVRPQGARCRRA